MENLEKLEPEINISEVERVSTEFAKHIFDQTLGDPDSCAIALSVVKQWMTDQFTCIFTEKQLQEKIADEKLKRFLSKTKE